MLTTLCALLALLPGALSAGAEGATLHIVHLNDFHARFEEVNPRGGSCKHSQSPPGDAPPAPSPCVGGLARISTAVRREQERNPEALFLNGGDNFQGTLWYSLFRWNGTAHFMNRLPHTALTLGNHEFDHGVAGVVPYMERLRAPLLLANVEDDGEPTFQNKYKKSLVLERSGRKVGIIGLIAKDTPLIAATGALRFTEELAALDAEAALLKEQGVEMVLALTHCGLDVDTEVARGSKYVDVIVGGHSHTLLYNGTTPSGERPVDTYPVVVRQPSGRTVLVVQASAYSRWLGNLTVNFDAEGEVESWSGNPIYLDSSIPEDPELLAEMAPWREEVNRKGGAVLGSSLVTLDKNRYNCYRGECTLGNFVTDAMVHHFVGRGGAGTWTQAAVALTNAGGLRTTIEPGNITYNDMVAAQPFENTIDLVELQGRHLLQLLEDSVSTLSLLHWAGLRVVFDLARPAGSRVLEVRVRCAECSIPHYEELVPDSWYRLAVPSYVLQGGDNYHTLVDNVRNRVVGPVDMTVFEEYLAKRSPVTTEADGRMVLLNSTARDEQMLRRRNRNRGRGRASFEYAK